MATKSRAQNPVVGDTVNLMEFAFNSNNMTDFQSIEKVEIYFLDPTNRSESNPDGRRLVDTITTITHLDTGTYQVSVVLEAAKYVIGNYIDMWYVYIGPDDTTPSTTENQWQVYPDLFYTSPNPICYDFNFVFRPNKIRQGSIRYLIIDIMPNVPSATDLARYYENLAIAAPLSISIKQICGDCMPCEEDLRVIADNVPVDLRDKTTGYYLLDTTNMKTGMYDVSFKMMFGACIYISDAQQLQIF